MSFSFFERFSTHPVCYDVKDQLKRYAYAKFEKGILSGQARKAKIADAGALEEDREELRARLAKKIGAFPRPEIERAAIVGEHRTDAYRIENIVITVKDGLTIPGNVYLPNGLSQRTGGVLFLSGHFPEARMHPEYQRVCAFLAQSGLVVFAPDPIGQGERSNYYDCETEEYRVPRCCEEHDFCGMQVWPVGRSLAAYFLRDAQAAFSYLAGRPEVDPNRIGVTGNSGGGMQTALMMLFDDRLAAAAPATFITSRKAILDSGQAQDSEQIWPGSALYGLDHDDAIRMIAPKPCLVLAARYDFFPMEGTLETLERARDAYRLYGQEENLRFFVDDCGHCFSQKMACRAAAFFARVLNEDTQQMGKKFSAYPEQMLWAVQGQVCRTGLPPEGVFEENCREARQLRARRTAPPVREQKNRARLFLQKHVFQTRSFCEPHLVLMPEWGGGRQGDWLHVLAMWNTQKNMKGIGVFLRHERWRDERLPLTIALWPDGICAMEQHREWIERTLSQGIEILVLDVSGMGSLTPNEINGENVASPFGTLYTLQHDLFCCEDSLCALNAFELCAALRMAAKEYPGMRGNTARLYAEGVMLPSAHIAYFLDDKFMSLEGEDDFSFDGWLEQKEYCAEGMTFRLFPGILQYCDLPDLKRWADQERSAGENDRPRI